MWGRNLNDETHYSQKLTVSSFGDVGIVAAPRTYGVNAQYPFDISLLYERIISDVIEELVAIRPLFNDFSPVTK